MLTAIICFLFGLKKCSTLEELRSHIKPGKISDLADWITWRIDYTKDEDPSEEYKPAEQTIKDGKGDCEDKAVVAWEVINTWPNWCAWLVYLYTDTPSPRAHVVCIYETPKREKGVIDGRAKTFSPDTDWGVIFKTTGPWQKAYWVDERGNREQRAGWSE